MCTGTRSSGHSRTEWKRNSEVENNAAVSERADQEKAWERRKEELRSIPPTPGNKAAWPKGVREVSLDEMKLGVDRFGRLYWDGKAIEIRELKLRWPEKTIALVVMITAVIAVTIQGWQWGCDLGWLNICP